jgi:hypothetical protein
LAGGSYGPESGMQTVMIAAAPASNSARFVDRRQAGSSELYLGCDATLEVDVDLTIKSSGGALNEVVRTTLVARTSDVAVVSVQLEVSKLGGSFAYMPQGLDDPKYSNVKVTLLLGLQVSAYGVTGSLTPQVQYEIHSGGDSADAVGSGSSRPIAHIGIAGCDNDGIAVPLDASGAASSQAAVALLQTHPSATASALDGSERAVTISFSAQSACLQLRQTATTTLRDLIVQGTLTAQSDDGRFDAHWPVQVTSPPSDTGAVSGGLSVDLNETTLTGSTLEERYGLSGIDVSGYVSSRVSVQLTLSSEGAWGGTVIAYGNKDPMCPPPTSTCDANGCSRPGCAGSGPPVELEHYTFR